MVIKKIEGFNRNHLAKKFGKLGFNTGVEVGVRWGEYSEILCKKNPKLSLKSVDPYDIVYQDHRSNRLGKKKQLQCFEHAKQRLAPYNCEIIKKTSLEAVRKFPYESIDFVYIDGSHEFDFVMCDIIEWAKRVKKGGIVSGHDYYRFRWGAVIKAVNIYLECHGVKKLYLTDERTPSWWFKKTW